MAAALYKKILKVKPGEEAAQLQLADASVKQGLLVDAKGYLSGVVEQRRQRGDLRAADEIVVWIAELEPGDVETRLAGAKALVNLGDTAAAVAWLNDIATDLGEAGRLEEALAVLRGVLQLDPSNITSGAKLVRACLAGGDVTGAQGHLALDIAGDDPDLLLAFAEVELCGGSHEQTREVLERVLALSPDARDRVIALGRALFDASMDASFVCFDLVTDRAAAAGDWPGAAAVVQEFVTRSPDHVPALLKLVEICVDGGLEAWMYVAQAQLADAYLTAGRAAEARIIAEDLVTREPWEWPHIERLRQALVGLGESDPDALIAERLSGPSLTGGEDYAALGRDMGEEVVQEGVSDQLETEVPSHPPVVEEEPLFVPAAGPESPVWSSAEPGVTSEPPAVRSSTDETSRGVFDLVEVVDDGPAVSAEQEIDVTSVLGDLIPEEEAPDEPATTVDEAEAPPGLSAESTAPAEGQPLHASTSLQEVFDRFRQEVVSQETDEEIAWEQYQLGLSYRQMGLLDEAIQAFEVAVRAPQHRFGAGMLLARLHQERGMGDQTVAWLEVASQMPAPTIEDGRALLYALGEALEAVGETARAGRLARIAD